MKKIEERFDKIEKVLEKIVTTKPSIISIQETIGGETDRASEEVIAKMYERFEKTEKALENLEQRIPRTTQIQDAVGHEVEWRFEHDERIKRIDKKLDLVLENTKDETIIDLLKDELDWREDEKIKSFKWRRDKRQTLTKYDIGFEDKTNWADPECDSDAQK
jgi:hypothetical protein